MLSRIFFSYVRLIRSAFCVIEVTKRWSREKGRITAFPVILLPYIPSLQLGVEPSFVGRRAICFNLWTELITNTPSSNGTLGVLLSARNAATRSARG